MTDLQKQLSNKYIAYRTFTNMYFIIVVWLFFYRLFISDQQVGILDGMAFTIGLLAEVPSGALADKFGRDKVVKTGVLLASAGIMLQGLGSSFLPLFIGQAILMSGLSFMSGADEALFFQNLNFDKNSSAWRKLQTISSQAGLAGSLFATILGGWLHTVNPRLPWIFNAIAILLGALVIWNIKDLRPKKERKNVLGELREYLEDIKIGFTQFRLPALKVYVPFILTVQGLFYTVGYGILRPLLLDRFDFNPFWGSVVVTICNIATIILFGYMHKEAERLNEKLIISLIGFSAVLSLVASIFGIGYWGALVVFALYLGEYIAKPFLSEILNNHAPEDQRATVLSVASFIRSLPYIILAPIIGYLSTQRNLELFFIVWAIVMFAATVYYLGLKNKIKPYS